METLAVKTEMASWMTNRARGPQTSQRSMLTWCGRLPSLKGAYEDNASVFRHGNMKFFDNAPLTKAEDLFADDLTSLWGDLRRKLISCEGKMRDITIDLWTHDVAGKGRQLPDLASAPVFNKVSHADLEKTFTELATKWKRDTGTQSSIPAVVMHPAYLDIIGMGPDAIPFILRDLQGETSLWFTALRALAKTSPVKPEDAGNLKKMREAWLRWGKANGYLD